MANRKGRRGWGWLRQTSAGRWHASYIGPDLVRHNAPGGTFDTKLDGEYWLAGERRLIAAETWTPPRTRGLRSAVGPTLAEWGPQAIDRRRVRGEPLRPRTRALYLSLLEGVILPELGHLPLTAITAERVADWYDRLDPSKPTRRAHAYSLLRTVMGQAVTDRKIPGSNPCQVAGAGKADRRRKIRTATPGELVRIAENMPEPFRLLVLVAGWCGLRYGELAELRRGDIDLGRGVVSVSRAVVRVGGRDVVGRPKSGAGVRDIHIPPHLLPAVESHLSEHVAPGADSLVFPRHPDDAQHLIHTEISKTFARAREVAGRPDLRLHDLRHTAATMAAQTGATLAELMARLGHSTPAAALRYQHMAAGRDAQIARDLSALAEGRP